MLPSVIDLTRARANSLQATAALAEVTAPFRADIVMIVREKLIRMIDAKSVAYTRGTYAEALLGKVS